MTSLNIFARPINYNEGSYKDDLLQSMKPGKYNLDANYANRKIPRRVEDIGFLGKNGVSIAKNKNLIDVDSKIRMPYAATRDPFKKSHPELNAVPGNTVNFPRYIYEC